jgi:hypothetical protein
VSWKEAGDLAFYAATAATVLFALLYLVTASWWKTLAGRNIMAVMGSMALSFAYFTWAIATGGIPSGFHPMRALLFASVAISVGWRVWILVRIHIIPGLRDRKRGEKNESQNAR